MNKSKNKCGTVQMSDFYIPPIAIKLRWMGHPSGDGWVRRTTRQVLEILR